MTSPLMIHSLLTQMTREISSPQIRMKAVIPVISLAMALGTTPAMALEISPVMALETNPAMTPEATPVTGPAILHPLTATG